MSPTTRAILAGLAQTSLFAPLAEDSLATLATQTQKKSYTHGQVVMPRGSLNTHVGLVLQGWVKLARETLDGAEAVIDVIGTNSFLGLENALTETEFDTTATAVEDCEILLIPAENLRQLFLTHPHLYANMLRQQLATSHKMSMEIESRALKSAPQRVGCLLLGLCPKGQKSAVTLHLPYDKSLLAARLGMQPETFSRALSALKNELNLTINGSSVHIPAVQALVAYTCSACSGTYPCRSKVA